jgi:hypothetical protein
LDVWGEGEEAKGREAPMAETMAKGMDLSIFSSIYKK